MPSSPRQGIALASEEGALFKFRRERPPDTAHSAIFQRLDGFYDYDCDEWRLSWIPFEGSTGAGSTGWLSSVWNMADGFAAWTGGRAERHIAMNWEDRRLVWVVREPFRSKLSGSDLVAGFLEQGRELIIESLMPANGVIFSDGIEADFLEFTSGTIARIGVAPQCARLVVP